MCVCCVGHYWTLGFAGTIYNIEYIHLFIYQVRVSHGGVLYTSIYQVRKSTIQEVAASLPRSILVHKYGDDLEVGHQ